MEARLALVSEIVHFRIRKEFFLEHISCIFCGTSEQDCPIVVTENGYNGRKCPKCSLVFISPRPTLQDIINLYGHDQAHVSLAVHLEARLQNLYHDRHVLGILKRYKKSGTLLEIGSGIGHFLHEARRQGFDAHGTELNPLQAELIQQTGVPCECATFSDAFAGRKFDIIYHCDVLSHLHDPIADIRAMSDRLNDGGVMIFETGNFGDVQSKYYSEYSHLQYPDHLFFFSEKSMKTLLNLSGMEVRKIYRYSILPHLRLMRTLGNILARRRGEVPKTGTTDEPVSNASAADGLTKRLRRRLFHAVRYWLGAVVPKAGRPQTILVVAQRTAARNAVKSAS